MVQNWEAFLHIHYLIVLLIDNKVFGESFSISIINSDLGDFTIRVQRIYKCYEGSFLESKHKRILNNGGRKLFIIYLKKYLQFQTKTINWSKFILITEIHLFNII